MSILSRFLHRIGTDDANKNLLMEDEGITTVLDLVVRGKSAGSAFTNLCIGLAIDYLKQNMQKYDRAPDEVLEELLKLDEWADNLWEVHVFRRYDGFGDKRSV